MFPLTGNDVGQALQLLEHIIKHGSENVVDDMRPYMPNIKLLGHFHYIDERGQDQLQGINGSSSPLHSSSNTHSLGSSLS